MLKSVMDHLASHQLTVLVTHWWEYFRDDRSDQEFIDVLHKIGDCLAANQELKVISFSDLVDGRLTLN